MSRSLPFINIPAWDWSLLNLSKALEFKHETLEDENDGDEKYNKEDSTSMASGKMPTPETTSANKDEDKLGLSCAKLSSSL